MRVSTASCFYCGQPISRAAATRDSKYQLSRDHLTPRSRGGGSKGPDNIVLCCFGCNQEKGQLTLEEYRAVRAFRQGLLAAKEQSFRFPGERSSHFSLEEVSQWPAQPSKLQSTSA